MHTISSFLFAALTTLSLAAPAQPRVSSSPAPRQYSFAVKKEGHGPALILIPGLYCSGDVWQETVNHYKDRYTCYSLTLPGFAGQPPLSDVAKTANAQQGTNAQQGENASGILARVAEEIAVFVKEEGIQKPIIIGHSLGGWLALEIETTHPGLAGGIVCVSSAPFLPALSMGDDISLDSARKTGVIIRRYMSAATPAQTAAAQHATLAFMIRDSSNIAKVVPMAVKSDPATQAEVMYELFSTDLRGSMNEVRCPVLVLGDWIAYKSFGATRENTLEKYQHQFAKAAQVSIALSDNSKHFIMFDEPEWFFTQVDPFLVSRHSAP
jgi:pimeloyl-ACP methyl ester carboxylesterase